jgi:hypothetical protein
MEEEAFRVNVGREPHTVKSRIPWNHKVSAWKTMKTKTSVRTEIPIAGTNCPKPAATRLRTAWSFSLLLVTLSLPATMPAQFSPPSFAVFGGTIESDMNVSTDGALVFAYDWNNVSQTINGVTFTAPGSGVTLVGFSHQSSGFAALAGVNGNLSPACQSVLDGATYGDTGAVCTVTLNNLSAGCFYEVEFWVNDSTAGGFGRSETFTLIVGVGFESLASWFSSADVVGSCGDYGASIFQAVAPTQDITVNGSVLAQINAMQLRSWAPVFTNFGLSGGGSLPLTFIGTIGQSYSLLTTSNLSLPNTNWTTLTSGTFGSAPVKYTVSGLGDGPHFYIIQSP